MQINFKNIIYIVGNSQNCFAVVDDKQVIEIGFSLYHLQHELKEHHLFFSGVWWDSFKSKICEVLNEVKRFLIKVNLPSPLFIKCSTYP